jgi:O-antigen/teichoic acid export membrane protein
MIRRLRTRHALVRPLANLPAALRSFFRAYRPTLWASGSYAAGEMYIYNFPSILVPAVHGLGTPTIVFDTVFKIFRSAPVLFSAVCDLLVPRQTRAYAAGDVRDLRRSTALALILGAIPAVALCALLLLAGDDVYRLLLGGAATVPSSFTPILVVLIVCNLFQTVSNFLLVHTGFFPLIARSAGAMVVVMTVIAAIDAVWPADVHQFAMLYMAAYVFSAALYAFLAIRHPLWCRTGRTPEPLPAPPPLGPGKS